MGVIKKFELSKQDYVSVINEKKVSYGGSQQWFSDRLSSGKATRTHKYGCGVIAASDLFMYWAMTQPYIKPSSALRTLEKDGSLLKENYMGFVEYVRDKYVYVLPKIGVSNFELLIAVNRYLLTHQMPYKAQIGYLTDERKLLQQMIEMLRKDLPIILLIGMPFPNILYHTVLKGRKVGVTFYGTQLGVGKTTEDEVVYKPLHTNIKGHYVVVTGILIDKEAKEKRDKVMLKISSWGQTYYMSYYEYCKYEIKYGVDIQGSIIYLQ